MGTITIYSSLKIKSSLGFKSLLKPYLQIGYLFFSIGIMCYILWDKPIESLIGLGIVTMGLILFLIDNTKRKNPSH